MPRNWRPISGAISAGRDCRSPQSAACGNRGFPSTDGSDSIVESPMADDAGKLRRFLHVKFKMPSADSTKILPILKAAIPAYEGMIGGRVRLFRNVDDPSQFVQVIEYDTPRDIELNRQ